MGKDKSESEDREAKMAANLEKFNRMADDLDVSSKKKKKKKDRKRERSPVKEPSPEVVVKKKKKKKDKKREEEKEKTPPPKEKTPPPPEPISAGDVAAMVNDAIQTEETKNLQSMKANLGQYTGATLEGGTARLDKFARLLGGKKKESKGLFGRKPANSVGFQRPTHSNVENGNDLNRELENQFYRAKNYHSKHVRGFQH